MKKIISVIALLAIITAVFTGCGKTNTTGGDNAQSNPQTIDKSLTEYSNDYFKVYLPGTFKTVDNKNFTVALSSDKILFTALKESLDKLSEAGINGDTDLATYTNIIIDGNKLTGATAQKVDGKDIMYFTYTKTGTDGKNYFYTGFTFKQDDAFWLMNFACTADEKDNYASKFIEWAGYISFNK